jgi:4-amino-4-deoxy-L-arabinose transferase-like glycosyltransferase
MSTRLFLALASALLLVRLPSLVQPMGADQGLYTYVGDRILAGDVPYRDAWDQKPPAIHYTYAVFRAIRGGEWTVPAADLAAAAVAGWLLFRLGGVLIGPSTGAVSALLFLLLSNPAFTRLDGVRLRAQCETFIAVAVTGAFLLLARPRRAAARSAALGAGVLLGIAFIFKYNTIVYAGAAIAALWLWARLTWSDVVRIGAGFCIPFAAILIVFAASGALRAFYAATFTYNVQYSGETYSGPTHVLAYLATFPIERARVDALWTLGGAGCLLLIAAATRRREALFAPMWVGAACISIAINGSRGLPQYFVQANPALALAAAWGGSLAWSWLRERLSVPVARVAAVSVLTLVAIGVWRVNQFPKLVEQTAFDARYALGRMERAEYLSRYADERKYSARAAADLAGFLQAHSEPTQRVYVFGFSCAAYVGSGRASASRFFWSRPVIVGFNDGVPGYGVAGLLEDLERHEPAIVALQKKDWAPDVADSADFFLSTPALAGWLRANYARSAGPDAFDIWVRKAGAS